MPDEVVPALDTGNTAWMLASCALVLLMTPGVALFYGGMVRMKSVLNMIMMSVAALAIVSLLWVFYGYSLALTEDQGGGLIGGMDAAGLSDVIVDDPGAAPGRRPSTPRGARRRTPRARRARGRRGPRPGRRA